MISSTTCLTLCAFRMLFVNSIQFNSCMAVFFFSTSLFISHKCLSKNERTTNEKKKYNARSQPYYVHFVGHWDWLNHAMCKLFRIENASILTNACLNTTNEMNINRLHPPNRRTCVLCTHITYCDRDRVRVYMETQYGSSRRKKEEKNTRLQYNTNNTYTP